MKRTVNEHAKVNQELINKFRAMENVLSLSCVIGDAQERDNVMRSDIKMRTVNKKIIGPALTVKLTPGDIVDPLVIFGQAQPGDAIVIDAFGETETSIWGGLMTGLCKAAGIVGAVIDGSMRDTDETRMLDFPVASKSVSPRASHTAYSGRKEPIEVNVPIVCGGVVVKPGDLIVADEIGVVVAPQQDLEKIYKKAKEQADKEEATRAEILRGATLEELLKKFGRI